MYQRISIRTSKFNQAQHYLHPEHGTLNTELWTKNTEHGTRNTELWTASQKRRAVGFYPNGPPHEKHEHKNYNKKRIKRSIVVTIADIDTKMTMFNIS